MQKKTVHQRQHFVSKKPNSDPLTISPIRFQELTPQQFSKKSDVITEDAPEKEDPSKTNLLNLINNQPNWGAEWFKEDQYKPDFDRDKNRENYLKVADFHKKQATDVQKKAFANYTESVNMANFLRFPKIPINGVPEEKTFNDVKLIEEFIKKQEGIPKDIIVYKGITDGFLINILKENEGLWKDEYYHPQKIKTILWMSI